MKVCGNDKSRYERNKKSFCIILCDVDNFKQVNDNNGNDAGDNVLVEVANVFRKVARGQDIVGRWRFGLSGKVKKQN